ncbi:EpsG family protein [Vibrio campbellii]|uniref:EpsG family protein n=1 Tax=Vibrio campbellii TaxID=680 RepID=UPI000680180F
MRITKHRLYILSYLVISVLYGLLLTLLPNELFRDRQNYIVYAIDSMKIMDRYDGLAILTNEPLFLLLNSFLSNFFKPEAIPLVFVFFTGFTVSFFILYKGRNALVCFLGFLALLLIPQAFHMQLVVLRQSFAASVMMWAILFLGHKKYFKLIVFSLGFIHSSMFIVFFFIVVDGFFRQLVSEKIILRSLFLFIVSIVISLLILPVAQMLALRQATEYSSTLTGVGGGNFILFSGILIIIFTQYKRRYLNDGHYVMAILGLSIYLGMYFFSPFAGRLMVSFLPFIICLLCYFSNMRALILMVALILLNAAIFKQSIEGASLTQEGVFFFNQW